MIVVVVPMIPIRSGSCIVGICPTDFPPNSTHSHRGCSEVGFVEGERGRHDVEYEARLVAELIRRYQAINSDCCNCLAVGNMFPVN